MSNQVKRKAETKIVRIVGQKYEHEYDDGYHFVIKYDNELWLIQGENIYNLIEVLQRLTKAEASDCGISRTAHSYRNMLV